MNIRQNKGFTLVEVLVAVAIGAFLLSMVVTVFMGAQATSKATTGIARSQESTRFASFFIERDIRMSGYSGCSKDTAISNFLNVASNAYSPSIEDGIFGWEFTGTNVGDNYNLNYTQLGKDFTQAELTAARTSNTAAGAQWTGNAVTSLAPGGTLLNLPPVIANLQPLRGSDIIVTSISTPLPTIVDADTNLSNPDVAVTDAVGAPLASSIETGSILKVGDCSSLDIFQNSRAPSANELSASGGAEPGNSGSVKWQKLWGSEATVYQTRTTVYYIGTGSSGQPALFSFSTNCGLSAACGATVPVATELVDGIENMQILYGEDTDSELLRDDVSNIYRSANQVNDFRRVVSLKIGLVVRSPDAGLDIGPATVFPDFELLNQVTINPPDDANQRFVNNSTVRLRNRGL